MPKATTVYRASKIPQFANAGKLAVLGDLFQARRACAAVHAGAEWRHFYQGGTMEYNRAERAGFDLATGTQGQMVRKQVLGILESWVSNRKNDIREIVTRSTMSEAQRHRLNTLNSLEEWYAPADRRVEMRTGPEKGQDIPPEDRRLMRAIFRHVKKLNRRPSFKKLNIVMDSRGAKLEEAKRPGKFDHWLRLSTLEKGKPILVPITIHEHAAGREGKRANTVQLNQDRDGQISVTFLYNQTAHFATTRAEYALRAQKARAEGRGVADLYLDLGLRTMFGTSEGDLLGRDWVKRLMPYDRRLIEHARYRQKHGLKVRSPKYDRLVTAMAGFITSEVNRVFNRLVETHVPEVVILERLNFRNTNLSPRMNRLLNRIGQGAIRRKLKDLEEKYGIKTLEVPPAYTSQECSNCHYVDRRNRKRKSTAFLCYWCGLKMNADVNSPKTMCERRSLAAVPEARAVVTRADRRSLLVGRVRAFNERYPLRRREKPPVRGRTRRTGGRFEGRPSDPRLSNPYFRGTPHGPKEKGAAPCVTS